MTSRSDYYAYRRGAQRPPLEYTDLRGLVSGIFDDLEDKGWFQVKIGKDCVDNPKNLDTVVLERLGFDGWPLSRVATRQPEEWLFTMIEFAYSHVSKPLDSYYHSWDDCGVHVTRSDDEAGRREFRERVNPILARYTTPYELRENGEIWAVAPAGLDNIEPTPTGEPSIDDRVQSAIRTFRRYGADDDTKRHAIRDLADVFEYLRSTVGTQLLSKDEAELFNIANNFGVRHHNPKQKTDYDSGVWLDWIFFSYLNSVSLVSRLLAQRT